MKLKITLFFCIVIVTVFLIYLLTLDKSISYVALGDYLTVGVSSDKVENYGYADYIYEYLNEKTTVYEYTKDFSDSTYRSTDLIRDINDNKKIVIDNKEKTLKNALIKADLLTISIGTNDVLGIMASEGGNSNFYDYLDEVINDIDELLSTIRKYCKEEIIFIGYYNPYYGNKRYQNAFSYMNNRVSSLVQKYNIKYVDIFELYEDNLNFLPIINDIHPSNVGYSSIFDMVKPILDKKILK